MTYTVSYHVLVMKRDIPALPKKAREDIRRMIEQKLTTRPEIFGKPLRQSLKGYRRLRVGDYRVVFRIEKKIVKIFCISHRSDDYKEAEARA